MIMNRQPSPARRMQLLLFTLAVASFSATASSAAPRTFSGTRTNISPGGAPDGRCAPAITVGFGLPGFPANGTSNLGGFSFTASQCIAGPPPGNYYDGQFEWTFGNSGSLTGTYEGSLAAIGPGQFSVLETILFTGGTGKFTGASGNATATGQVQFGLYEGAPASFGNVSFAGSLQAPGVPEPSSWAMLLAGFGLVGAIARRRTALPARAG